MNYYSEIKTKLLNNEAYERVKDYSKEKHRVLTYFEIGRLLNEAGKHYGEGIIQNYAESLRKDFGKKYDKRLLYRMRKFYLLFNNQYSNSEVATSQKVVTIDKEIAKSKQITTNTSQKVVTANDFSSFATLTWSHYETLVSITDNEKRKYYTNTAITNHLSVRELRNIIKSKEYERLDENTRNKLINKEDLSIKDYIPNPILIKNTSNSDVISEKILHNLIMEDIASFMKELGEGYCFIDSEYKIKIDDRYNYIDFLLYNYIFKCFVVIELKIKEFKSEYVGQILKYMHYIDSNIKTIEDNNTIGIIICKRNNQFYLEYCSDERIISREYKLIKEN